MNDWSAADELSAAMALSMVPGAGPKLIANLIQQFGSAKNVFLQPLELIVQVDGIGPKVAAKILSAQVDTARDNLQRCQDSGVSLSVKGTPSYPKELARVDCSPNLLYVRGTLTKVDSLAVAIVGSRRCTAYGRKQAELIAGSLARSGFTIVSGLARGIDAAAHRGALNAGGRTIAVMATGVREIYPPEHAELAVEVSQNGAIVSEFPLDQKPRPGLFPQRNRIISGLSQGVVVIEATRNSGALHTTRHAFEQGREVFAVPGNVDSLASAGCLDLIRDGVTLVRNADDVLEGLGPLAEPLATASGETIHDPREVNLNEREKEILNQLGTSPVSLDEVLRATQLDYGPVLSTITVLEMKKFIRRLPGNMLVRR